MQRLPGSIHLNSSLQSKPAILGGTVRGLYSSHDLRTQNLLEVYSLWHWFHWHWTKSINQVRTALFYLVSYWAFSRSHMCKGAQCSQNHAISFDIYSYANTLLLSHYDLFLDVSIVLMWLFICSHKHSQYLNLGLQSWRCFCCWHHYHLMNLPLLPRIIDLFPGVSNCIHIIVDDQLLYLCCVLR